MYKIIKRFLDLLLGLIVLVLISPFLILVYIVLKIDIGGKIIFKQERFGLNMEPFVLYKFKSMLDDTTLAHDDRITKVSLWIRRLGLDELPNIFNIIKGDISFVGPRPLMTNDDTMPDYAYDKKRYSVKPGLFGLAQYKGRRNINTKNKIKYDLEYVDNISFWLDFKLLFLSIFEVISENLYLIFKRKRK